MSQDDPFPGLGDADRTLLKPTPGGRRPEISPRRSPAPDYGASAERAPLPPRTGLNPLETAASSLLALLTRLKNTLTHPDPEGLRSRIIEAVKAFEKRAYELGVSPEVTRAARYVMCTVLDEAVLITPWGNQSTWRQHNLLITFHNEAHGGEKFFRLLNRLLQNPTQNRDLLELMYICLALGFQGRYRLMEGGTAQVEAVREGLYQRLRDYREIFERDLSPHWRGVTDQRNPLIRYVPVWVAAALAGLLLLATYFAFSYLLNTHSDPQFNRLAKLGETIAPPRAEIPRQASSPATAEAEPVKPPPDKLRQFLAEEIKQQLVTVIEAADRVTVRIRGDNLFRSGSGTLNKRFYPLIRRIADALKTRTGDVLVTGHTDSDPIRTVRFPSNFDLSQARAEAVTRLLAERTGTPARFTAEGRADAEPLAKNDSRANKALNRRVEIILLSPPEGI
jgi:type VI secretion system protein ImpK